MIQIFTGTVETVGAFNGEDISPFIVWADTNPLAGASTFRMPTAGTLRNLHVVISNAFGAGTSGTFRFTKGGVAQSLSVTLSDLETQDSDTSNSVTVAENDEIAIDCVRSGATANATLWFSFEFETATANESMYGCGGDLTGSRLGGTAYNTPFGGSEWQPSATQKAIGCSASGAFTQYTVTMTHAPGAGQSWTFHLLLDGTVQDGSGSTVDTGLIISDAATNGTATFTLPVAAFQRVAIRAVASAAAAAQFSTNITFLFASTHPAGVANLAAANIAIPASSAAEYAHPLGGGRSGLAFSPTESGRVLIGGITPIQISQWTITLADAPGVNVVFMCRVNGADTELTTTFGPTDTEQTITAATLIDIGENDTWSVEVTQIGGMSGTATPSWVWLAGGASSRRNLLTGLSHQLTGSDNFITGRSGEIAGDRNALFALCESSPPPSITGSGVFKVCADVIDLDAASVSVNGSSLVESLDDLADVALGSPLSDGDVLTYDDGTGFWTNAASTGGGALSWQGPWDAGTAYATDDVVEHNGSAWIATEATTGDEPGAGSPSPWDLLVSKGDTGAAGGIESSSYATRPAASEEGKLFFPTDGFVIERDTGGSPAAWQPWGPIFPFTAPIDGDFSWVNQETASVSTTNGGIHLIGPAGAGEDWRVRVKSAPSTPYTITIAFLPNLAGANTPSAGLVFRQSSDGKLAAFTVTYSTGLQVFSIKLTDPNTFSATYTNRPFVSLGGIVFFRIADTGVNRVCSYSYDGQNFVTFHSVGRTDFLTADQVGFAVNANNASNAVALTLLSWEEG